METFLPTTADKITVPSWPYFNCLDDSDENESDLRWCKIRDNAYLVRYVICSVGIFLNLFILGLQLKLTTYRKTQFLFGFSLSIADLLSAVFILTETTFFARGFVDSPVWCATTIGGLHLQSYLSILGVACDRYMALCAFPIRYKTLVTPTKYVVVIAVTTLLCFVYSFILSSAFDQRNVVHGYIGIVLYIAFMTAITAIYSRLWYWVWKAFSNMNLPEAIQRKRNAQTRQLLLAFAIILGTIIICVLPARAFAVYIFIQPPGKRYELIRNIAIGNWLYNLQTIVHCMNPLIYWTRALRKQIDLKLNGLRLFSTSQSKDLSIGSTGGPKVTTENTL